MNSAQIMWNSSSADTSDYEAAALRTAKDMGTKQMNLIHAAMGLASDAGEFVDCIKKHAIYGKELDVTNAIEELGDVLWFVALACDTLNVTMGQVMQANIDKLAKRYPEKYTDEAAIARADKIELTEVAPNKIELTIPAPAFTYAVFAETTQGNLMCIGAGYLGGSYVLDGAVITQEQYTVYKNNPDNCPGVNDNIVFYKRSESNLRKVD